MLPSSCPRKAAGKGWGIKVRDFIPESLAGAKEREEKCLTVLGGGGGEGQWGLYFALFCFETQNKLCLLDCSWSTILALF